MNNHRWLYLLLMLVLVFTLSACGQSSKQEFGAPTQSSLLVTEPELLTEAVEMTTIEIEINSTATATTAAASDPTTEPATEAITESAAELETEPETNAEPGSQTSAEPFVYCGLVELLAYDDSFIIDQKYATTNNFTGVQQYDRELCLVNRDIVEMLITANKLAKENGLRLKIWDAYRPISVQQALHDSAPEELAAYVPAPSPYSMHARGISVDVTLCDMDGNELNMPTRFDDFSEAANSDYEGASVSKIANRELLNMIMSDAGFQRSRLEWWHFDGPNRDDYEILDVSFAEFEEARDR